MNIRIALLVLVAAGLACSTSAQGVGWVPRRNFSPDTNAGARASGDMLATDDARGVVVSFGADEPDRTIADTWEWGGVAFTPRDPTRTPPWRRYGVLVHDDAAGRTILFGGTDFTGRLLGDTWEWDGETWQPSQSPQSPGPAAQAAATWMTFPGHVVLFGGGGYLSNETWLYASGTWTRATPTNRPQPRYRHALAYDEASGRAVLFGGETAAGGVTETYTFDGQDWRLAATVGPGARRWPGMAYDRNRGRVVLFGGTRFPYGIWSDTWEWDGVAWTQRAVSAPFETGVAPAIARDPGTGSVVCFAQGKTFAWNGSAWSARPGPTADRGPVSDDGIAACTDTSRSRVIAVGGGTYEWDGIGWARTAAMPGTIARQTAMAHDATRAVTVLFGGRTIGGPESDQTFEWNGAGWAARTFAVRPSPRTGHAMAFDAAAGQTVLFGGASWPVTGPVFSNETWTYDGSAWTRRTVSGPSARSGHAMAFDPQRARVVLYGGGALSAGRETWEWDGTAWTQATPATDPGPLTGHAMAWDPTRGEVVLFGGAGQTTAQINAATWSWNGLRWARLATTSAPEPRYGHGMAFDPVRGELLVHGGRHCPTPMVCAGRVDTWSLVTAPQPAQRTSLGSGCAGGASAPRLTTPLPHLGNRGFALELSGATPGAPAALLLAGSTQPVQLGGCAFYARTLAATFGAAVSTHGGVRLGLPIPDDPSLRGAALVAQGVVLARPGTSLGLDATAGVQLVFGD